MRTAGSVSELPDNLDLSRKQGSSGSSKADKLLGSGIGEHFCSLLATELNEAKNNIQIQIAVVTIFSFWCCTIYSAFYLAKLLPFYCSC